jgi:ABC-2 type transport system ATP-binding protein
MAFVRQYASASDDARDALLKAIPGVTAVSWEGAEIVVAGSGNVVPLMVTALSAEQIVPLDMRVEQANLEDAFVALTGRQLGDANQQNER